VVTVSSSERMVGAATHAGVLLLAMLTSWAAGLAGVLGAGAVLFFRPLNSDFVAHHAREALNFNLTMFILAVIAVGLLLFTLGIAIIIVLPIGLIIGAVWIVCSILAAMAAYDGKLYRYPFSFRFF